MRPKQVISLEVRRVFARKMRDLADSPSPHRWAALCAVVSETIQEKQIGGEPIFDHAWFVAGISTVFSAVFQLTGDQLFKDVDFNQPMSHLLDVVCRWSARVDRGQEQPTAGQRATEQQADELHAAGYHATEQEEMDLQTDPGEDNVFMVEALPPLDSIPDNAFVEHDVPASSSVCVTTPFPPAATEVFGMLDTDKRADVAGAQNAIHCIFEAMRPHMACLVEDARWGAPANEFRMVCSQTWNKLCMKLIRHSDDLVCADPTPSHVLLKATLQAYRAQLDVAVSMIDCVPAANQEFVAAELAKLKAMLA